MIPLKNVIYTISGHQVIPISPNNPSHSQTVIDLKQALQTIQSSAVFYARRANDISNNTLKGTTCFEEAIVNTFNALSSLRAKWLKSPGYPDIEITDTKGNPICYVEVKVTSTARKSLGSPRDFYISPGKIDSMSSTRLPSGWTQFTLDISPRSTMQKIRGDAAHILLLAKFQEISNCSIFPAGYQTIPKGYRCWRIVDFSLYDLSYLKLSAKLEFNTDYRGIITKCPKL